MKLDQLGLLLWKNYVVRKRQPGILALVFVWPVCVFMMLYIVRDNIDPEYHPTCQFPGRSMPRDGLLSFVQSFVCSIGNPCEPLSEYEPVPSYKNASLGPLLVELQPMLGNATILSAVRTLPKSIQLLKSMAQIVTRAEIKALIERGIRLADLFNNLEETKTFLKQQLPPRTNPGVIDTLFSSSVKLSYLLEIFGSTDISGAICAPKQLKNFLILESGNEEDFSDLSALLCGIDTESLPAIFANLTKHLDFSGLLSMIDRAMAQFRDYDFFLDLRRAVETILSLKTVKKYVPEYLHLEEWMPKVIMLFKKSKLNETNQTFIEEAIEVLDPILASERDWKTARQALVRVKKLLPLVKGMLASGQKKSLSISENLRPLQSYENLTRFLDLSFAILQDGAKLTRSLLDRHADDIKLADEVADALRDFFSDNVINSISYIVSLMENIVEMSHHITSLHQDTLHQFYRVLERHRDFVEKVLRDLDPKLYSSLVRSFSRLDFVERFVDSVRTRRPEDLICQEETFNDIFDDFKRQSSEEQAKKLMALLCSDPGRELVSQLYDSFGFDNFQRIISNTLSTVISMAFKQPVRVEKSNLTSVVRSVESFVAYLETPKPSDPDWTLFHIRPDWIETFRKERPQGRLDLLGIHLSIAKMLGSRSLSYISIKPDLQNMEVLAGIILRDLHSDPTGWIEQVRLRMPDLIQSFYLTVSDREKVLRILEHENFTRTYCTEEEEPAVLLNFPTDANQTILKDLVCRLSTMVQTNLALNISRIRTEEIDREHQRNFNWTGFNEKTIEIYQYIDTLIHSEDGHLNQTYLEKLRDDFRAAWSSNVTVKDAWEISVGLICKVFTLMESPLFDIQSRPDWKNVYAIAWASSVIFDNIEKTIDQIQRNEGVAKLSEILADMPQTQILLDTILRNLSPFVMDIVDIITLKPIYFISVLDEYKSREQQWPCVQSESVGSVLELRNGSREILREIERISCNPGLFIHEWLEQPILMRVRKIFQRNDTVHLEPFNWTLGYQNFRRVVGKFDNLISDNRRLLLEEEPKLLEYIEALTPEIESIFHERMPNLQDEAKTVLDYVDIELDKTVKVFRSNRSASELWEPSIEIEDRILVLSKFISHVIHKATRIASDILRSASVSTESTKISLVSLLGFDGTTSIGILYNRLPYILSTLSNGLSDPELDKQIGEEFKSQTGNKCTQFFQLWKDFAIGLTPQEYTTLQNFICDQDPLNFNAYTDLYMSEMLTWRKPVNLYRSYVTTAIGDLHDLFYLIFDQIENEDLVIERPFSKSYVEELLDRLRESLEAPEKHSTYRKDTPSDYEWTESRLFIEGLSEAILHISRALKNYQEKAVITLPDLVESSDVRELLRILERSPEESIALLASLTTIRQSAARDGYSLSYADLRKSICTFHLNSSFWSTPGRSRFLREICRFDPYQLLSSITSDSYSDALTGQSSAALKRTPISGSLIQLLDAISELRRNLPNLTVHSSILNITTWRNLSNETWALIQKAEFVWMQEYMDLVSNNDDPPSQFASLGNGTNTILKVDRFYELLTLVTDLLSGGDVWEKFRVHYEASKVQPILSLMEDLPNFAISALDTFLWTERLTDFAVKLLRGDVHPCDIDKYLVPGNFMRKESFTSSITNFCGKVLLAEKELTLIDVLPIDARREESRRLYNPANKPVMSRKESDPPEKFQEFQSTVIRIASEGFQEVKLPGWWMSFKEGTYKDFLRQYQAKDVRAVAHLAVRKVSTVMNDVLKSVAGSRNCSWCSTLPIEIVNSQLVQHELYAKLLCEINRMSVSELHDTLMHQFYWNKTSSMIKSYKYLNRQKTVQEVVARLKDTLHYVVEIIMNFQNDTYRKTVKDCYYKFVGGRSYSRPGLYISLVLGLLDALERNVYILDTASNHRKIGSMTRLAEERVPIWKPLENLVKSSAVDDIKKFLPNAMLNVNGLLNERNDSLCRRKVDCQNATVLYEYLISKRAGRIFRYQPKASGDPSLREISEILSQSLDLNLISREISRWRQEAAWDLTWLKELLHHLSKVLGEGSNLLDVASKIDLEDVSDILGVPPDVVDGLVNVFKDKTVDKLFAGIKEILHDIEPFVKDQEVMDDLNSIVITLESMEIFKNLGLLDMKYAVRDMFDNWDLVRSYLIEKLGFSTRGATILDQAKIDMVSVFMKSRHAISLKDTICSPEKLEDILNLDKQQAQSSIEDVSTALCRLNGSQAQNVTIRLIKNLNFDYILKNLMTVSVKNIFANANMSETDGKMVLENFPAASELIPIFRDRLSSGMSSFETNESAGTNGKTEAMSTSKFLEDSSKMLCGKRMTSDNSQLYKIISQLEDDSEEYDKRELDSLPSDFCRDTYKGILAMPGGKILWSFVKPLLRGQILYAPETSVTESLMRLANDTFKQMETFSQVMTSFERTLTSLADLSEMGETLRDFEDVMSLNVTKIAIKSFAGANFQGEFSDLKIAEVASRLNKSRKLIGMVGMLNDLMGCVLIDRTRGFPSEEALEEEARTLMERREFLAGVVFLEEKSPRFGRSLEEGLPDNVTYKIRMDVDYVPSTRRMKNQFWIPGPESSFIEHLRYLRGFVQLQDSIDRAIIQLKTKKEPNWRLITQQMPYPCWKDVPFQTTLYESQGVQVCFFFALMMCVGSAVRHIVWERESRNSVVMSVMGLKPWRNTLAWFVTSFAELLIVIFSISLILLVGKILPSSDPLLVMVLLIDYIFSVVTFCYMISTLFSSASLAAVTTVVMFLLTYMPYIIVIAMEAVIGLGYKLLICLSMSTSFCYGCLYAVRKEVQGVGLTWSSIWEESSPGDPMSLALVLLTIAFDGCLYAIIGYLIARYTNSGKAFHDLRARSLWWDDTRRSLTFVNNLYFTSDTYQEDESDVSRLTVSEKHAGVRFEKVRKVYDTDDGVVVAVEDFSLKLVEGEVTSLLGRNGAGKTTIIKMLTGMLAPSSGEICLNGTEGGKPDIGVCPQDNVLIGSLTPREHMLFYARLKRSGRAKGGIDLEKSVNEMLASLELGRQEHEPVNRLSGGTRRRLCVALAFLGSPKLVILDEPGAGVDPAARRRIWRLIDQHRIGCTVLLSTHHLDEADMLSDTVVVMHKGRILCTGSPLTLKLSHGHGYKLNVIFPLEPGANAEANADANTNAIGKAKLESLQTLVEQVVPNASINEISGSEVTVTLPFQGKGGMNNDIAQAAKALEDSRKLLGFSHFSLECDTLERVFLELCARADSGSSIIRASQDSVASVDHVGLSIPNDDIDLIDVEPKLHPRPIRQAKALLKKRIWHFTKDWRSPLAALLLPTMFVAVAMGFSLIRPPSENEPPLDLTPKLYDTHPVHFYSTDASDDSFIKEVSLQLRKTFGDSNVGAWQVMPNDTGRCQCVDGQQTCQHVSEAVEGLVEVLPGRHTLDWIVSTHQEYIEKRYGGWSLSHHQDGTKDGQVLFIVWFNNKGHHALPSYINALNQAVLRAMAVEGRLTTLNHPLKLSRDQLNRTTLLQHVADVGVALVLLIAYSMVAAQGTKELVRERLSEEKRILYLAGVHPITYWITALIWDYLVFLSAIALGVMVFEIFALPTYVERDNLAGVCLLLALFAWASIPFSHLVEKAFDEPSLSNMVLFCVNTFIGVASLATILVIDILGKTKAAEETRNILHNVLMIFPQYVLGDALVQLSRNDITAELLEQFNMQTYKSPLGWDLLGLHYVFLAIVGLVLFLLNLTIECGLLSSRRVTGFSSYEPLHEDDDVSRERIRVEAGGRGDSIQTIRLRKEYRSVYGRNIAVQNLSLGVESGKCFGLLGTNGAGKSTTFKMLTTEVAPTAGRIMLNGKEVGSGPLSNGEVGYCPQSDALDAFLSPHQCLTIHGEVCGLIDVPRAVERTLKKLDLLKYAHRRVDSLSGGNKRKLCTAISVMAPVSVVLMDEPTSGMDPATKDFVAKAVRNVTKNQTSVILTSHSVGECENLCDRVGILARAGLRCIGSAQHLKHKFGEGYVAFLRFRQPVSSVDLRKAISKYIPEAVISSRQASAVRLLVPRSRDVALSTSFTNIKLIADELKATDYTLTQSSLDQVLVNFSEELDEDLLDRSRQDQARRGNVTEAVSTDTIYMDTF